jgi:sugar lactone lactonase YvrE
MYWTHDNGVSLLMRANLDGSNSEIIDTSLNGASYITLDTTAGHIYLTSYGDGSISRMDIDGSNSIQLVSGSAGPVGNAVDLVNRKIYWSGGATFDWIKRADLDGNNVETIVTGLNAPQDIVYDADNDRIYWVDALNILVQRSDPDGTNIESIVSTGLTRPRGIILVNSDDVLPECNGTFRDDFNTIDFSGSDGSLTWTTDWLEVGESNGADSGDIRVTNDQSEYQLRLRDNDNGGEGVAREADLTGASVATLRLKYRRSGLDGTSDYVSVEISSTGTAGPWTERGRFVGSTNDSNYLSWSYTLEAGEISANTAIRLRTSPTMGRSDNIYFDDIKIQCSP